MSTVTRVPWWRTDFDEGEIERAAAAIRGERIAMGAECAALEREFAESLDMPWAVMTPSGSVALLMSLLAHDIGPGDEVIVPDRTFIATAHAVQLAGAKVVLVDTEPTRPVMDVVEVEDRITSRTRAILPVHLGGRSVDLDGLRDVVERHRLVVIEDACQALYSRSPERGQWLGTEGAVGCYSLGLAKLLSSAYGGMIVGRDSELETRLRALRNHGITGTPTVTGSAHADFGFNFKVSDILAAVGREQLRSADARCERVREIYERYEAVCSELESVSMIPVDIEGGELPLYAEARSPRRDALHAHLMRYGIQSQPLGASLHDAPHLAVERSFPCADRFAAEGIILPCGPTQPIENVEFTVAALSEFRSTS